MERIVEQFIIQVVEKDGESYLVMKTPKGDIRSPGIDVDSARDKLFAMAAELIKFAGRKKNLN